MEHLLFRSKNECSIFYIFFKNLTFQRRRKALVWSKGLIYVLFKRTLAHDQRHGLLIASSNGNTVVFPDLAVFNKISNNN